MNDGLMEALHKFRIDLLNQGFEARATIELEPNAFWSLLSELRRFSPYASPADNEPRLCVPVPMRAVATFASNDGASNFIRQTVEVSPSILLEGFKVGEMRVILDRAAAEPLLAALVERENR